MISNVSCLMIFLILMLPSRSTIVLLRFFASRAPRWSIWRSLQLRRLTQFPAHDGWKEGAAHYFCGDFTQTTVIDDDVDVTKLDKRQLLAVIKQLRNATPTSVIREDKPAKNADHPTMKPVALVERNILASSLENQTVLDLFGGSGTTMIASHKHKRQARLMEWDPRYAEATLIRFQEYAGKEPMLVNPDGTLTPYSEVKKARQTA